MRTVKERLARLSSRWLSTALFMALLSNCAAPADDRPGDLDDPSEQVDPEDQASRGEAQDEEEQEQHPHTEKGLRSDYCCAYKTANYVDYCENVYMTNFGARLYCGWGDNKVRTGRCSQYESCWGKTTNP